MGTLPKPPGKAMYVAPRPDWDWLRIVQRKLYERSEEQVDYVFCKLWGLVTDPRNLRVALARVAGNRGRRTAGVDGITVGRVTRRAEDFVAELRSELRSGAYRPSPVRRVLIPKIGTPGKFRPLGIPTVKDRVVQVSEKVEGTVSTLEGAWNASGTVAPSRCHVVCHRPHSGRAIPAGLGSPSSLRHPSRRAGCITKGARPVREGGARNPTGESWQGAERPPHQNPRPLQLQATT